MVSLRAVFGFNVVAVGMSLGVATLPATAAERATLQLRGVVPPTVGVTLQVDPLAPIVTAVTAANAPAAAAVATINSTGNSAFQLLLMTDMPAEIVNRGATLMFNGAPLQFASGVAVLNGMMATGAGVREQRGELLIAARAPVLGADGELAMPGLDETYTLVVRAP